jgi:RNA polymerase sigma factor (sigma-70 family)
MDGQRSTKEQNWGLDCAAEVEACLQRICSWRVPPNWSAVDWRDEIRAVALGEAWKAECEFDFTRGVPLADFVHSRLLARVLTRYRQEWSYGLHCLRRGMQEDDGDSLEERSTNHGPVAHLDKENAEVWEIVTLLDPKTRRLVIQLFCEGRTEAEIARELGLSQRAVSKRKQAALGVLRQYLQDREKKLPLRF